MFYISHSHDHNNHNNCCWIALYIDNMELKILLYRKQASPIISLKPLYGLRTGLFIIFKVTAEWENIVTIVFFIDNLSTTHPITT